jgi:proteasome lid subunit RPN8/RPN11
MTVTGYAKVPNTHEDPEHHYRIRYDRKDERIIGILHSHSGADHLPEPSQEDRMLLPWWMVGGVYRDREIVWFVSSARHPWPHRRRPCDYPPF